MATFPTPFSGSSVLYPLVRANRRPVAVLQYTDGTEQRYKKSAPVAAFTLELREISGAEKDAIVEFFEDSKGSFDATWDIDIGSDNYDYMAFAEDSITATNTDGDLWSMTIRLVQTRKD